MAEITQLHKPCPNCGKPQTMVLPGEPTRILVCPCQLPGTPEHDANLAVHNEAVRKLHDAGEKICRALAQLTPAEQDRALAALVKLGRQ